MLSTFKPIDRIQTDVKPRVPVAVQTFDHSGWRYSIRVHLKTSDKRVAKFNDGPCFIGHDGPLLREIPYSISGLERVELYLRRTAPINQDVLRLHGPVGNAPLVGINARRKKMPYSSCGLGHGEPPAMLSEQIGEGHETVVIPRVGAYGAEPATIVVTRRFNLEQVRMIEHAQRDHLIELSASMSMVRLAWESVEQPVGVGLVAEHNKTLDPTSDAEGADDFERAELV
jgi:hypothetical protein